MSDAVVGRADGVAGAELRAETPHPAKFSREVLDELRRLLDQYGVQGLILDPFAGTGRVHELTSYEPGQPLRWTLGVELEPEWADMHRQTIVGDATNLAALGLKDEAFAAVVTSPPYGNRMADGYDGRDGSRRHTYRCALGRSLTDGSAAGMQWGEEYRRTMQQALIEMHRVLKPGGLLFLNISDHIRSGVRQSVVDWFFCIAQNMGFLEVKRSRIATRRNRHGANAAVRADEEWVLVFRKPA